MKQIIIGLLMVVMMTGVVSATCWEDVCETDETGNFSLSKIEDSSNYVIGEVIETEGQPSIEYNWLIDENNNIINTSLNPVPFHITETYIFGVGFLEAHFNGTNWTRNTSNKVILETKEIVVQPFTPFYVIQNDGVSPNITIPGNLSEYVNWCMFRDGEAWYCSTGVWKVDYYEAPTQEEPEPEPAPSNSGKTSQPSGSSRFAEQTIVSNQGTTTTQEESVFEKFWNSIVNFFKNLFS